jgi:DNA-binding HxlR family transcriptional regulator
MTCSIARSLDIAGEWWTPLVLRDIWMGRTRFEEIQENLDVSRKLLAGRLDTLVREGVLSRHRYQDRPPRHEYLLTEKGEELVEVLLALLSWGDRWTATKAGPPMLVRHKGCGKIVEPEVRCSGCGEPLRAGESRLEPGPGLKFGWGTRPLPERHPLHAASLEATKERRRSEVAPKSRRKARH